MNIINLFLILSIIVGKIDGVIGPPISEYFGRVVQTAERNNAKLIIFMMDTPGGLDESMRDIVKTELNSDIPIVIFIYPHGARCASAGVFILYAAHFAVMSHGTNIGSAHPVSISGKMSEDMREKITNDAAAYIRSIAKKRNRNIEWAEDAVRKSVNVTAEEALALNIIDFIADSKEEIVDSLDGKVFNGDTLKLKGEPFIEMNLTARESFLKTITNPNIAYVLLMLGLYALIFELMHPGAIFPGVFGAVSLALALYGLHVLPVNYAGLGLIILGVVLFVLEALTPTFGPFTIGGVTSTILGSLLLIRVGAHFLQISRSLIVTVAILFGGFFSFALTMAIKAMRRKPVTGQKGYIGRVGKVRQSIKGKKGGVVFLDGALWRAISDEEIKAGENVEVIDMKGLVLIVKRTDRMF